MPKPAVGTISCPCCDLDAEVRETDKGKPYIVCDDCGFQGFARGQGAVAKLRTRMKPLAAALAAAVTEMEADAMTAPKKPAAKPAKIAAPKKPAPAEEKAAAPPPKDDDAEFRKWLGPLGIGA